MAEPTLLDKLKRHPRKYACGALLEALALANLGAGALQLEQAFGWDPDSQYPQRAAEGQLSLHLATSSLCLCLTGVATIALRGQEEQEGELGQGAQQQQRRYPELVIALLSSGVCVVCLEILLGFILQMDGGNMDFATLLISLTEFATLIVAGPFLLWGFTEHFFG